MNFDGDAIQPTPKPKNLPEFIGSGELLSDFFFQFSLC